MRVTDRVDFNSTESLQHEFDGVRLEMDEYHEQQQFYKEAYKDNVYYKPKPNQPARDRVGVNLLQAFADKNWEYVSPFPKISVPAQPNNRDGASKTEKFLLGVHDDNEMDLKWSKYTLDGTLMGVCINITDVNYKTKKIVQYRVDPRRAYWKGSDLEGSGIEVFWHAVPMRRSAIKRKFGINVTGSQSLGTDYWREFDQVSWRDMSFEDPYYMVITRIDHEHMTRWCGDKFLMRSHKHLLGCMPVEIAFPIDDNDVDYRGDFFLRRLKDLQAEFNEQWRQRGNIVRKLGNPAVWGRNVNNNQLSDVKEALSTDGGFIGLKENGELGILTIPETQMIDKSLIDIYARMQDVAGFPPATFGAIAGANTSGDALGVYFQPTTRKIDHQNKAYGRFLKNINKKTIILARHLMGTKGTMTFDNYGNKPRKQVVDGSLVNNEALYEDTFTSADLITTKNIVTCSTVTPKDDIGYKRLMMEMARDGVLSKTTALDEMGFLSPQDEIDLLSAELSDARLNPEGTSKLLSANAQMMSAENMAQQGVPNVQPGGASLPSGSSGQELI